MEPKICVALGGGAARGLAHLGVLKALEDARITVHRITGTSLGALVGGLYASRPEAAFWMEEVEQFLRSFRSRKTRLEFIRKLEQPTSGRQGFFSDMANLIRKGYFWGVTATSSAFISEEDYQDFLYPLIPDIDISETQIPFGCVATDIQHGKRVFYTKGSLRKAISASCALPGIFPPVKDGNRLLIDGGWVERVPVRCSREMGAAVVIAVDVSKELPKFEYTSGLDIVLRADAVTRVYLNKMLLNEADVIVHPDVGKRHWADFSDPWELFRQGESAVHDKLVTIRTLIHREIVPHIKITDRIRMIKEKITGTVTKKKP